MPRPDDVAGECPFAPRCQWADDICRTARPELVTVSADRQSRCVRIAEILPTWPACATGSPAARFRRPRAVEVEDPVATVTEVHKTFRVGKGRTVDALRGVSLAIGRGEAVGLVGESGSGKTTLGRCIAGLELITSGTIDLDRPRRHGGRSPRSSRPTHRPGRLPGSVLVARSPPAHRRRARRAAAPRRTGAKDAQRRASELLDLVGLPASYRRRRPDALSGGERQRVAIARALSVDPQLLVCDEPVSALDVSVQAQILKLFRSLRHDLGLSLLFITHDLAVVRQVVDTVHIMYRGEIVESGTVDDVMDRPQDDYTRRLIASIPGEEHDMTALAARVRQRARPPDDAGTRREPETLRRHTSRSGRPSRRASGWRPIRSATAGSGRWSSDESTRR